MCPDTRAPPVASAPLPWPRAVALWDPMPGSDHRGAALGMERARWATPPAAGRRGRRGPGPRGTGGPATLGPPQASSPPPRPGSRTAQGAGARGVVAAPRGTSWAAAGAERWGVPRLARHAPARDCGAPDWEARRRPATGDQLARRMAPRGYRVPLEPGTTSVA